MTKRRILKVNTTTSHLDEAFFDVNAMVSDHEALATVSLCAGDTDIKG